MREILFRGLHRRKGEKVRMDGTPIESMWVYGGYCQYNEERGIIYQTEPNICKYPVYADSVGQYTGLNDKNGVRIFEGEDRKYVYDYANKLLGRPIFTHEFLTLEEVLKERAKPDFIEICKNLED